MSRSLEKRLALGVTVGMAAILASSSLVVYHGVRARLYRQFDEALLEKARSLATLVEQEHGEIEFEWKEHGLDVPGIGGSHETYQFWLASGGDTLLRSPHLGERDLPRLAAGPDPAYAPVLLADGNPGRAVGLEFVPKLGFRDEVDTAPIAVEATVALETASVLDSLAELRWLLASICVSAMVLGSIFLVWIVRRNLKPLSTLAHRIGEISEDDLDRRVELPDSPAELVPVVDRLNRLIDRVGAAFRRERSFTANAAHELRTPLAGLRSTLDLILSRPREAEEYREAAQDCLEIGLQMERLVEKLLSLSRLESGQSSPEVDHISLETSLRKTWTPYAATASKRGLRVHWAIEPDLWVDTDPQLFGILLGNLIENAVEYADEKGLVSLEASRVDGHCRLAITNSAGRISDIDLERVLEPFWRGNVSPTETGRHAGLGLAICKKLATVLESRLSVTNDPEGSFRVELEVPTSS